MQISVKYGNMDLWPLLYTQTNSTSAHSHSLKLTMSQEKLSTIHPCIAVIQFKQFTLHLKYFQQYL